MLLYKKRGKYFFFKYIDIDIKKRSKRCPFETLQPITCNLAQTAIKGKKVYLLVWIKSEESSSSLSGRIKHLNSWSKIVILCKLWDSVVKFVRNNSSVYNNCLHLRWSEDQCFGEDKKGWLQMQFVFISKLLLNIQCISIESIHALFLLGA